MVASNLDNRDRIMWLEEHIGFLNKTIVEDRNPIEVDAAILNVPQYLKEYEILSGVSYWEQRR